ncbi:polysaccharide export protein [Oxynema aestuarii AP17]|uniref:Polysaccharide export protein n=2 Tax=Oxynema TaxID=1492710 RepID=A0A6H1U4H8_9CYAN|nr:polysaccharide export protein [Oxynema aestuarii AP17]RMH78592.1 MAG: polysaccharide export protein [Cyanobacteria bacterium J007]
MLHYSIFLGLATAISTGSSLPVRAQLPTVEEAESFPISNPQFNADPADLSDTPYRLGGGDRIRIDIFDLPELSAEYQIPIDGRISLPLIGTLSIQGMTLDEADRTLESAYARVLKRPLVTLILLSPRPLTVRVAGEVNRPGSYTMPLTGGVGNQPGVQYPNILQAIDMAEGITLAADIRQVQLRRLQGSGQEQTISLDLWKMLQTGEAPADLTLRDGDIIFIPTAETVRREELRQLASAGFAPEANKPRAVTVIGEVKRPGSYIVIGGNTTNAQRTEGLPTVTRAIQLAGGITPDADLRRIQLRRTTKIGARQVLNIDLWELLQAGDIHQDTIVQDGDTIVIPTATEINPAEASDLAAANFAPEAIQVTVVGEVSNPGGLTLPGDTPMNQAILAAGGFNKNRAKTDTVGLIRFNPDGTVSRREVQVDFTQSINGETNPLLRENDIILVGRSGQAKFSDTVGLTVGPAGMFRGIAITILDTIQLLDVLGIINR